MSDLPESISESVEIENVVTSADTNRDLDLNELCIDLPEAQFNPEDFPGLIYRSVDEKVAVLIFRSGKIVCTGASSIEQTHRVIDEVKQRFDEIGLEYDELDPSVQNVVGVADMDSKMNLNAIAIGLGLEDIEYEPEQFPGLIYRGGSDEPVSLLFGSGKLVITGGRDYEDIESGVATVYGKLEELALV